MTTQQPTIGFLGAGNMAEALIKGILAQELVSADRLSIYEISDERRDFMRVAYALNAAHDVSELASADMVVLAVKPQHMKAALEPLKEWVRPDQVFVSIAAGLTIDTLRTWLGGEARIIRVMPNTPALVGEGISALSAGPGIDDATLEQAVTLLGSVGQTVQVPESSLDAVTALSGSGPAYVFYLLEAMCTAGETLGLNAEDASRLALQTVRGAATLALASEDTPATLRAKVTSKGGTTEAAINHLDQQAVKQHISDAVQRAAERSRELSQMG